MSDTPAGQPAQQATPILDAHQLEYRIESRTLWQDLEFQLCAGERLAVTGPSGSGKTLLLRTLAGLEPAASGEVRFEGKPAASWSMPQYRAHVVYLPQRPAFREGTVQEAIEAPFRFHIRHGQSAPMDQVRQHLDALGRSEELLKQPAEHLSGGELQMVALLRALAVSPRILMLDEPTASLDKTTADCVESLMASWLEADGQRASIWTSHDSAQLKRVCDRSIAIGGDNEG